MSEYKIFQTRFDGIWYTKVMRGPWHVVTYLTYSKWGGKWKANQKIRSRSKEIT